MFAIEQCLLCLGHHPAVWHQAAHFLELSSKILTEKGDVNAAKNLSDEAATMFERATNTLLSKNMLLYFAHADFEEGRVKYEKVHQIYQKFLDIPDIDPTLVGINCTSRDCATLSDVLKYPFSFTGVRAVHEICEKSGRYKVREDGVQTSARRRKMQASRLRRRRADGILLY